MGLFGRNKTYSGYTEKTVDSLIMDAGAYFKNYDVETDTYDTAVEAGKLIGATRGGGSFTAKAAFRKLEIDGVKGAAKGLQTIDEWVVTIAANVLEITKDNLKIALGTGATDTTASTKYDIITAKNYVDDEDYIENITWVGRKSGSKEPVIIQIYNALNTEGLTMTTKDKDEVVTAMTFTGHYDAKDLDTPPFKIFYPKSNTEPAEPEEGEQG